MKVLLALIVGAAIGFGVYWYVSEGRNNQSVQSARDSIQDTLKAWHLTNSDITNELNQTGKIVRQKASEAGKALSDATADARITAVIKTKLLGDPSLSAWNISVNTTDGLVTLSGSATSAENIGKAIYLAMQTDGVHQVISTIVVKKPVPAS